MAGTYDKARAVFLAALMVVSVFGGSMAFAGTAAAASGLTVDDGVPAQPDGTITVSVDVSEAGNSTYFLINGSEGNTVEYGPIKDGGETDLDGSNNSVVKASLDLSNSFADGEATIHASEGSEVSTDGSAETSNTFTIDGTSPSSDYQSPANGTVINDNETTLDIALSDETTAINETSIEANVISDEDGEIFTYHIDSDAAENDGVDYANGNLTIDFGTGNVPALPDGQVTADVYVEDTAGNSEMVSTTFTVDTESVGFALDTPSEGDLTDNTQDIVVDVNPDGNEDEVNDSSVTLSVKDDSETELFNETSENVTYDANGENKFVVSPTDENPLTHGNITVNVSAEDKSGNSNSDTYTFEVDNESPSVTDITVVDAPLNESDLADDTEWENETRIVVTFDESVNASSVSGDVRLGGEDNYHTLPFSEVENSSGTQVATTLDLSGSLGVENSSASVNITAAEDTVGNTLTEEGNTTFVVDTVSPSVSEDNTGVINPVSGYVDLTDEVTIEGDVTETTYMVLIDGDENNNVTLENASNLDTRSLPEGTHLFGVYVEDDVGNSDVVGVEFTVDNEDPTITRSGTSFADAESLTDLFVVENEGVEDVSYELTGESAGNYQVTVTVDDPGFEGEDNTVTETFALEGDASHLVGSGFTAEANGDGTVTLEVPSALSLDSLTVTAERTDDYHEQVDKTYTLDEDFSETHSEHGYKYTLTTNELGDGAYEFTFESASTQHQTIELGSDYSRPVTVDAENASVIDADVVDGGEDQLVVNVTFSEPVAQDSVTPSDFSVEGVSTSAVAVSDTAAKGYVEVTFDSEFQTGDGPTLVVSDDEIVEATGAGYKSDKQTETINTVELNLEEGLNIVSIPAEAGSVELNSLKLGEEGVDSVMEYDKYYEDDWAAYDAQTGDGGLQHLEGGDGYIIKVKDGSSAEIDLNAYNVPSSSEHEPGVPSSEQVEAGWNLLGHYQEGDQSADKALSTINVTPAFADGGNVVMALEATSGYNFVETNTLKQNGGYWVFVEESDIYAPVDYASGDTVAPDVQSVTVTDNDDDTVVNGDSVTVSATVAGDVNVVSVDASPLGNSSTVSLIDENGDGVYNGSFIVDTSNETVSSGDVSLTVTASNGAGAQSYGSDSITLEDNTSPSAALSTPDSSNDAEIFASAPTIKGNASDEFGVASVEIQINNSTHYWNGSGLVTDSSASVSANYDAETGEFTYDGLSGIADGNYTVTATVTDANGNQQTVSSDLVIDTTSPTSLITSPTDGDTTNTSTVNFTFSDDTSGVASANLTIENSTSGEVLKDSVNVTGSTSYDISDLSDGNYTATLNVTDNASNTNSSTVDFTRDTSTSFESMSASTGSNSGNLNFSYTPSEDGESWYVVVNSSSTPPNASQIKTGTDGDGLQANASAGPVSVTANTSVSETVSGLTSGDEYTVYVLVEDSAKNQATSNATATAA